MTHRARWITFSLAVTCLTVAWSASAQDDAKPTPTAPPSTDAQPSPAPKPQQPTDPTVPSEPLRAALNAAQNDTDNPRPQQRPTIPQVALKALIVVTGKPAVGLIEIEERLYTVRDNDTVVLGDGRTLDIQRVDHTGVQLHVQQLNKTLIIR